MSNAFGTALNPPVQSTQVWGEIVQFEATHVILQKGVRGGVEFDADIHDAGKRVTRIDIAVQPISESRFSDLVKRDGMIAEFPKDAWQKVTLPSLHEIGIDTPEKLQALEGKFVRAELVKYDSYTKKDGTAGDLTALKFVEVFENEDACIADFNGAFGNVPATKPATNGNGSAGNDATQRKLAENFLASLVNMAGGNRTALENALKNTALVKEYFTIDSPEVQALLMNEAQAEPF